MNINPFLGMHVRESIFLTVPYEDWSEVRSPGRARRRMKRGFPQNVKHMQVADPNVYVTGTVINGHPETIKRMIAEMNLKGMN